MYYQPLKQQLLDHTGVNDLGEQYLSQCSIITIPSCCPHYPCSSVQYYTKKAAQHITVSRRTRFYWSSPNDTL